MNRLLLRMPKALVKDYIHKHYLELTESDAIYLLGKGFYIPTQFIRENPNLHNSKEMLKKTIPLHPNYHGYLECFSSQIIDAEIVSFFESIDYEPSTEAVEMFPFLLNDQAIRSKVMRNDYSGKILNLLTNDQIDADILKQLEENHHIATYEEIIKYPNLINSEVIIKRAINSNSINVLTVPNLDFELIKYAVERGFIAAKEDLQNREDIKAGDLDLYQEMLVRGLAKDPTMITLFTQDFLLSNAAYGQKAVENGYVPTEADLIKFPQLSMNFFIMEAAVKADVNLIKFLHEKVYDSGLEALDNYALRNGYIPTEEDLINHPNLCVRAPIIHKLMESNLDMLKYYKFLGNDQKHKIMMKTIQTSGINALADLPFLNSRFGSSLNNEDVRVLLQILALEIDPTNDNEQAEYYAILDRIIDGAVNMRYEKAKPQFKYPSIDKLFDEVNRCFSKNGSNESAKMINELSANLTHFVSNNLPNSKSDKIHDYIYGELIELYRKFAKQGELAPEDTTTLFNRILNEHGNIFRSTEKQKVIDRLMNNLPLAPKKEKTILTGRKLKKISELIASKSFDSLGTTEDELMSKLFALRSHISNWKAMRKENIAITDDEFSILERFFVNNRLTEDVVRYLLKLENPELCKSISDKYNQIKLSFINRVELTSEETRINYSERNNLGWNYNSYLIGNPDFYNTAIAELMLDLNPETLTDIILNKDELADILRIIPLVNLVPEFGLDDLKAILANYPRVKERIVDVQKEKKGTITDEVAEVIANFDSLIKISNGYASADDMTTLILGEEVIKTVGVYSASSYLDIYLKMFTRNTSSIPKVSGEMGYITFESGNNHDPERLLIGNKWNSCVTPFNSAGAKTYNRCLLEDDGDVLMFKAKKTNEFLGRMLMFREGNVVMLAPLMGTGNITCMADVANQIMHASSASGDNIEYVFLNNARDKLNGYPLIQDTRFKECFPHADLGSSAYLIGAKDQAVFHTKDVSGIDLQVQPAVNYKISRKPVVNGQNVPDEEITRLRALRIKAETNKEIQDELARNHEPFFKGEYENVFVGHDWYIAVRNNGAIEEVIIPTQDRSNLIEFAMFKEGLSVDAMSDMQTSNLEGSKK